MGRQPGGCQVGLFRWYPGRPLAGGLAVMVAFVVAIAAGGGIASDAEDEAQAEATEPVSFYRQVRPILQRHCVGCHQPAKKEGDLLLTSFEAIRVGGDSGAGFVPGKPAESVLVDYISGDEPLMPLEAPPLAPDQVALIARWIEEGAVDDTPADTEDTVTPDEPPVYVSPPVITALAYSPDSEWLAVSGFHEVLLHSVERVSRPAEEGADRGHGTAPDRRLVGRAQRIESLAFSPDGGTLAVVGGTPALFGEVQFWDAAEGTLRFSTTVSHDTLFGASFNSDGTLLAFGGADNRAYIVRVEDGEPVVRMDAHSDWVFGTTFSLNLDQTRTSEEVPVYEAENRARTVGEFDPGEHLVTVSRDMSMKLTFVETAQFIDNITSITPGALKGGLMAVERHPQRDQVLTGGADGEPKLYRIFREQARAIGDDFNRVRSYEALPGRIFDLRFNEDGSRFVIGASTATDGTARIYDTDEGTLLFSLDGIGSPVFAVAYRPDGGQVAVAGFDGRVRLYDARTGELESEFVPVPLNAEE